MSTARRRESSSRSTHTRREGGRSSRSSWDERANLWVIHPIGGTDRDWHPRTWMEQSVNQITGQCTDRCINSPHFNITLAKRFYTIPPKDVNRIMRSLRMDLSNKDAINGLEALRDDPLHTNRPRYGHNIALGFKWHSPCSESVCLPSEKQILLLRTDSTIYLELYEMDVPLSYLLYEAEKKGKVDTFRSNLTERIERRFADSGEQPPGSTYVVLEQLCYLILDDESRLLTKAGRFLRYCDNQLASRVELNEVAELQEIIGKWRGQLHIMNGWCTRYIHNVRIVEDKYKRGTFGRYGGAAITEIADLLEDLHDFQSRIGHLINHTESTFSTLIGTINILQAHGAAKLTWVAFVVVPINVMVALCGTTMQRTFGSFPIWEIFGIGLVVVSALEIAVYMAVGVYKQKRLQLHRQSSRILMPIQRRQQESENNLSASRCSV